MRSVVSCLEAGPDSRAARGSPQDTEVGRARAETCPKEEPSECGMVGVGKVHGDTHPRVNPRVSLFGPSSRLCWGRFSGVGLEPLLSTCFFCTFVMGWVA